MKAVAKWIGFYLLATVVLVVTLPLWGDPLTSIIGYVQALPNPGCFGRTQTELPLIGWGPRWCTYWHSCGTEEENIARGYDCGRLTIR